MIGSLMNRMGMADKLSVAQLQRAIQDGTIPAYVGIPMLQDKMAQEKAARAAALGMQQPQQQPPIAEQVMQEARQQAGLDTAQSNLPEQYAEGGIINFAKGGAARLLEEDDLYEDADEREAAELAQLYGTGSENDFIQSIVPAARRSGKVEPSSAVSVSFEPKEGIEKLSTHKYADLVAQEAKRQGRDPKVLLTMLHKETGGLKNPETARSKAGAMGIAQFMPKTAKQYGINPDIPEEAAYGMVKHFGYLEDKYGDPKLAMAAYNWGEGNLNKWLKAGADRNKLPRETRQYASLAQGGIASIKRYDEGDLVQADPDAVRQAYIDAARLQMSNQPNVVPQAALRESESRIKAKEAPNFGVINPESWDDEVKPTPVPKPAEKKKITPDETEKERERNRFKNFEQENKNYIETLQAKQNKGIQSLTDTTEKKPESELSSLETLHKRLLEDAMKRREELKQDREMNKYLALMQAGFGMMGSKSIIPLQAIGEGAQQGIGTYAALRKQEGEEAKDIAAQELGAYKYGASAKNAQLLNEIRQAQQDLRKTPEERARDEAEREYTRQVAAIDKRQADHAKQFGGELDPYYQEQYDRQRAALREQIYKHFNVPVQTQFKLPPIVPKPVETKPTLWQKITGTEPKPVSGVSPEQQELLDKYK